MHPVPHARPAQTVAWVLLGQRRLGTGAQVRQEYPYAVLRSFDISVSSVRTRAPSRSVDGCASALFIRLSFACNLSFEVLLLADKLSETLIGRCHACSGSSYG